MRVHGVLSALSTHARLTGVVHIWETLVIQVLSEPPFPGALSPDHPDLMLVDGSLRRPLLRPRYDTLRQTNRGTHTGGNQHWNLAQSREIAQPGTGFQQHQQRQKRLRTVMGPLRRPRDLSLISGDPPDAFADRQAHQRVLRQGPRRVHPLHRRLLGQRARGGRPPRSFFRLAGGTRTRAPPCAPTSQGPACSPAVTSSKWASSSPRAAALTAGCLPNADARTRPGLGRQPHPDKQGRYPVSSGQHDAGAYGRELARISHRASSRPRSRRRIPVHPFVLMPACTTFEGLWRVGV
ncbi:hypothetical protein SGPA1_41065 [Streptomyces misionensis JCM 4497]